jgi:hypothetical protein
MPAPLTSEQKDALAQSLYEGRKIEAIKQLRELTGLGLKDAKDFVEKLEAELRVAHPERFTTMRSKSGGCWLVLILLFPILVLIWFYVWRPR